LSFATVAVGVPPLLFFTVYTVDDVRPWMNASASIVPLLSESYWMASPTPMLAGKPLSKVAVDPDIVNPLLVPLAKAAIVVPTLR
jgi:hypothetical protein